MDAIHGFRKKADPTLGVRLSLPALVSAKMAVVKL